MKILIVDDQRSARRVLRQMLSPLDDVEVTEAANADEAFSVVQRTAPDLLLLDIRLSQDARDRGGLDLLRRLRANGAAVPAVMVTSLVELAEIREAMRSGAQDYVLKDELCPEMLLPVVETFRERLALRGEVARLREKVDRSWGIGSIVGSSRAMESVRHWIRRVADANATVLIRGETGTGKELVARALHSLSPRAAKPFVVVNCAAIPEALLESELFGYTRGAFTGAVQSQLGRIPAAQGGTLFLDEVSELPLGMQAKLLRFLEQKEIQRLGSCEITRVDARVVAASNVDLASRASRGEFRQDLFYRLSAFPIELPPLAERRIDIVPLAEHFLACMAAALEINAPRLSLDAIRTLENYPWRGNVRELQHVMERASILVESGTTIEEEHLYFASARDARATDLSHL